MLDYNKQWEPVLLITCGSAVIVGAILVNSILKLRFGAINLLNQGGSLNMPQLDSSKPDNSCSLTISTPPMTIFQGIRGLFTFTKSIDRQEKADKALIQVMRDFTLDAQRHKQEFDEINRLRMQASEEQEYSITQGRTLLADLSKRFPGVSASSTKADDRKTLSAMTPVLSLEEIQERLQKLHEEYDSIEFPKVSFSRLSASEAEALCKQVQDGISLRQNIHKQILELSCQYLQLDKKLGQKVSSEVELLRLIM